MCSVWAPHLNLPSLGELPSAGGAGSEVFTETFGCRAGCGKAFRGCFHFCSSICISLRLRCKSAACFWAFILLALIPYSRVRALSGFSSSRKLQAPSCQQAEAVSRRLCLLHRACLHKRSCGGNKPKLPAPGMSQPLFFTGIWWSQPCERCLDALLCVCVGRAALLEALRLWLPGRSCLLQGESCLLLAEAASRPRF